MDMEIEDFSSGSESDYQPTEIDTDTSYDLSENEDDEEQICGNGISPDATELVWHEEVLPIGREQFTGISGIHRIDAITNENGKIDFVKIFEKLLTADIVMEMVEHTNTYAHILRSSRTSAFNRLRRWKDVEIEVMKQFFGVVMLMGVVNLPKIEHYWKLDPLYNYPLMHMIKMSYKSFSLILRCWHFASPLLQERTHKTYKIDPLIKKLLSNFRSLYTPGEILVVDESVIKFHGRR
ncbi:piggyBac transposable element-derived protein 4-like isoform X2 [Eupeodes corollae]|uniref:piggyBac transposable element-derived protein 4-like isoform X2 n=1 Tax=Eupeodes corollae TaxID=290404 RepID=UPI00249355F2|nr:piggyBac transposable element-derived protein 4-like isoform X2 [Eupeodes corollae]